MFSVIGEKKTLEREWLFICCASLLLKSFKSGCDYEKEVDDYVSWCIFYSRKMQCS